MMVVTAVAVMDVGYEGGDRWSMVVVEVVEEVVVVEEMVKMANDNSDGRWSIVIGEVVMNDGGGNNDGQWPTVIAEVAMDRGCW